LPFLGLLLYPLLGTNRFRDIVMGSDGTYYIAGPGYDMITRSGVPDIKQPLTKLS